MKIINKKIIAVSLILFIAMPAIAQDVRILKDSVVVDSVQFILEELKINTGAQQTDKKIYEITQNAYDIFDRPYLSSPEHRLKEKKDSAVSRIASNTLRETNSGFEHYELYYDRNKLTNFSIAIQSYGSPWEAVQYYCFDLKNGERIGAGLFTSPDLVLRKCRAKLKSKEINITIKQSDLSAFKIITGINKKIAGIEFIFFDTKNYRNSGYEKFTVHFDWEEIRKYVSPAYLKRLENM